MIWVIIAALIALAVVLYMISDRDDPLPVEECDACGQPIVTDRCKLVETGDGPDGSGWAMTATFHPCDACCPIVDPDHRHAGQPARLP